MQNSHGSGWLPVGTLRAVALSAMSTLSTSALSTEVLEDFLLTLEQVTTGVTVLALNASRNPSQSVRVWKLLGDLLADIQDCEGELETNGAS